MAAARQMLFGKVLYRDVWFDKPPLLPSLFAGFVIPNLIALVWMWHAGSLQPYIEQVWIWGAQYAGSTFMSDPIRNGAVRTLNWLGFHAALVVAIVCFRLKETRWI